VKPLSIPVIGIVGWSGAGKTTFLVNLIAELKRRGYRVATIKHSRHADVRVDVPGSDTWRHAEAGSDLVVLATPRRLAILEQLEESLSLEEVLSRVHGVDIILVEGYKFAHIPKVEISRKERGEKLLSPQEELIALVTDQVWELPVPQFNLDDAAGVADLLKGRFLFSHSQNH